MPNTQPDREYIALQSVRFIARYKVLEIDLILGTPSGEVNGVLADDLSCVAARRIAAAMNAFEEPPTVEIGPRSRTIAAARSRRWGRDHDASI